MERTILLTGFEGFGGDSYNPSTAVVEALHGQIFGDLRVIGLVLPVDTETAPAQLIGQLERMADAPVAVVALGMAEGRQAISLERVAVNMLDFGSPDNAGNMRQDAPIVAGGTAAYLSTLPLRLIASAIAHAGVPVFLSESAGLYLCNQVMYVLLHYLSQQQSPTRAGFIHLPATPQMIAARLVAVGDAMHHQKMPPTMNLADQIAAISAALTVIAASQE